MSVKIKPPTNDQLKLKAPTLFTSEPHSEKVKNITSFNN